MPASRNAVGEIVRVVRRQYIRRKLLAGAALGLLVLVVCGCFLLLLRPVAGPNAFMLALLLAAIANALVWGRFLILPLLRSPTNRQIALYIEEHVPDLEDRLNSAVEAGTQSTDPVVMGLLADTATSIAGISPAQVVHRLRERVVTYGSAAAIVAILLLAATNWQAIQKVTSEVTLAAVTSRPFLTIAPGNMNIERGEDQQVVATFRSEYGGDVDLAYQVEGGEWVRERMIPGASGHAYLWEFLDVQAPIAYYIVAGGRQSDVFQISLYEFPAVTRIDLTYRFPKYTGLPNRTEKDHGDIEGPTGSEVTVAVHTTATATEATLVMASGADIELRRTDGGLYRGNLVIQEENSYRVVVRDREGKNNQFPIQYLIVPIPDSPPKITIHDPGRDIRASAVEEVLIAADAEDDYGITSFSLHYSVNGDEEQEVDLLDNRTGLSLSGETLLFLEDYVLEPGDVISYYLQAADVFRKEVTDMYFIEVRPFDQSFRQLANAGNMEGAQRQSGLVISQQEIIAATWRLLRRDDDREDFDSALQSIVQAQDNLRTEISERIASTALSLELRTSSEQRKIVEYLQQAVSEMENAVEELGNERLHEALTPERRALTFLLRADAQNTERMVAQQSGRGGGRASATEERMSELMDLELDISKNKYETQQQGSAPSGPDEVDEAMQRVKDLARRQQSLADITDTSQMIGEERKRFVDRLQRDQEALSRQVEQLSQSLQSSASESTRQQLDRAARNMTEAQRALRKDNIEEAAERQHQALRNLQQLEQDLTTVTRGTLRERIEQLNQDLANVSERERRLAQQIQDAADQQDRDIESINQERSAILEDTEHALSEARELEQRSVDQDQRVAAALRNLQQVAARTRLLDSMRDSQEALANNWMDAAVRVESQILEGMEQLDEPRAILSDGLPVIEDEELARSLDQLAALQSELEQLDAQSSRNGSGNQQALNARIQQQLERTQELVQQLREDNPGNNAMRQTLRGIENALARADHTGVLLDEESAKAFFDERFMVPLVQLQLELRQRLDYLQLSRQLFGGRKDDIPPEYRAMVEKYFESLSRQAGTTWE